MLVYRVCVGVIHDLDPLGVMEAVKGGKLKKKAVMGLV